MAESQIVRGWNEILNAVLRDMKNDARLPEAVSTLTGSRAILAMEAEVFKQMMRSSLEKLRNNTGRFIPQRVEGFQRSAIRGKLRRELDISSKRRKANELGQNLEVPLERCIVGSFEDSLFNQFNLISGINNIGAEGRRSCIDIIDTQEDGCLRMIELKQWKNTEDSPIFALLETMRYFFSYKELSAIDRGGFPSYKKYSIVVLAPQSYYAYWEYSLEKLQSTEAVVNAFLKANGMGDGTFSFKTLNVDQSRFVEMLHGLAGTYSNLSSVHKQELRDAYNQAMTM